MKDFKIKKIILVGLLLSSLAGFVLPAFAGFIGGVSEDYYYDVEQTLLPEVSPDLDVKLNKYWDKNLNYSNKYRPIFMLSNKELTDFTPQSRKNHPVNRVIAPSIYNVSFSGASLSRVGQPKHINNAFVPLNDTSEQNEETQISALYNAVKNGGFDSDKLIDTAILIKSTKSPSVYFMAHDLLDEVIEKEPYNAYAYYIKGELYSAQDNTEKAMKNYVQALKLNPYSKKSYLGIARLLEPTNKQLANKYYQKAR